MLIIQTNKLNHRDLGNRPGSNRETGFKSRTQAQLTPKLLGPSLCTSTDNQDKNQGPEKEDLERDLRQGEGRDS